MLILSIKTSVFCVLTDMGSSQYSYIVLYVMDIGHTLFIGFEGKHLQRQAMIVLDSRYTKADNIVPSEQSACDA